MNKEEIKIAKKTLKILTLKNWNNISTPKINYPRTLFL